MPFRCFILVATGLIMLAACGRREAHQQHAKSTLIHVEAIPLAAHPEDAVCVLQPASGSQACGMVRFHEENGRLRIVAHVTGLQPGSKHAIHIHVFGDLRSSDGTSLGSHFDPGGHMHGRPGSREHHAGDLGNLSADGAGEAQHELNVDDVTLAAIIGRSVVVHADADDFTTQPSGNAGSRISIGVIGYAKPAE